MLGDFITRILVLLLGYAYPAFECYKTVEKNRVDIEELRFWCQYWILVALIACSERIGDIIISWVPFYGELKVAFFVYLWYPKTKGTAYVYGTLLRPYIAQHETEIDRKLMAMRARAWDFFAHYWRNCAHFSQETLAQAIHSVLAHSAKFSNQATDQREVKQKKNGLADPASEPEEETESEPEAKEVNPIASRLRSLEKQASKGRKWPPPTPPPTPSRSSTESPRSNSRFRVHTETTEDVSSLVPDNIPGSPLTEARARLRRSKRAPA